MSCDKRFRLKMCPPQFHISGGAAEGGGHIQRDLFDLHRWSVFCECVCEIKGVYILPLLA